jgi:hypothetical protein
LVIYLSKFICCPLANEEAAFKLGLSDPDSLVIM